MRLLNRISPTQILWLIAFIYLSGFAAHALYLHKTVYGDGTYYYSWLTLNFVNNKFAVGPAILWAPVYIFAHNQFVVGAVSVLAALFALILLYDTFSRTFSKTVSIMTIATVAGATNLLFYGSLDTVNSHAASFFAASVFLVLLLRRRNWFAVGLALGIVCLMRAQDLLIGLILIPFMNGKNSKYVLLGSLVAFTPQLIAWHLTTGRWFVSPYLAGNEGFNVWDPQMAGVLFGIRSGLFLWTPAVMIGVAGLIKSKKFWFLLAFLAELYAVSSWSTWWQGGSYSGRMFVSSLPIIAFGIASVFAWLEKFRWTQAYFLLTVVGPLSILNGISIIYFLAVAQNR